MRALIVRRPVGSFFLFAFLLSWIAVLPVVLNPSLPPEPFQILGGLAGPTLSALLVLAATEGSGSIRQFFRRYLQWHEGVGWWLLVLFGTLVVVTLVAAVIVGAQVLTDFIATSGWRWSHTCSPWSRGSFSDRFGKSRAGAGSPCRASNRSMDLY